AAPVATSSSSSSSSSSSAPARAAVSGSYSGASGSYQACVIARESGGNSQVMNSSGHYGLYQFSAGTWSAYGGSSADFGHASVSEQNRVFNNAMAQGGQSNWSPYDGC
ncbi:MAG TPA: transglycosylase family protein, partial [Streptosporangiaceae bacterium]